MSLENNELVEKFINIFCYTGYLKWFEEERIGNVDEAILISDPSNICGIVYTDKVVKKCRGDTGWKNYNYNGFKPSKKDTNYVLFEGQFYPIDFILKTFNKFFNNKANFDIRICSVAENDYYAMLIKINSIFSIGVANLKEVAIKEEKGGVLFQETDWIINGNEERQIVVDSHYVPWNKGMAIYETTWYGKPWKKVVYNQDYLFDKQEEIGDSLLI